MLKRFAVIALTILLVPALVSAEPRVVGRAKNGVPNFITGDLGRVDIADKSLGGDSATATLRGILMTHLRRG